jgi:hypothetical protein
MKYFTPDLYLKFNSDDSQVADRADKDWERAIQGYRKRLNAIATKLPEKVQRFAQNCNLHDSEVLTIFDFPAWLMRKHGTESIISILLENPEAFVQLTYWLSSPLSATEPRSEPAFSRERRHWLYDEIDLDAPYVHEILFSDGSTLKLHFLWFTLSEIPKEGLDAKRSSRIGRRVAT